MKKIDAHFTFEKWDDNKLIVNKTFAEYFQAAELTTFDALMNYSKTEVAKNLLQERVTSRFCLQDNAGNKKSFFIKRHSPSPLKEYIKPLFRFRLPILGAKTEWDALLRFHAEGIPTMMPVLFGQSKRYSLLVTEALEDCLKLSDWMNNSLSDRSQNCSPQTEQLIKQTATIARTMHQAGMHHQDFYLGHLLMKQEPQPQEAQPQKTAQSTLPDIHVIDLGRACYRPRLATRWIVKDLAQLDYSASQFTKEERILFMESYLNRPLNSRDNALIHRIQRKSAAIARHSKKNRL
ncbi:hypothetical protein MNBD_PLANCTO02-301 [hydrothermal vent metagenome]|uniref:Lipopolysaccharide core heptose(I) kinase RfaP n=1 Tax=hydrothermal vent metagenome TaxID=652676 RepID=A0A3B1E7E6_9ZZZZ